MRRGLRGIGVAILLAAALPGCGGEGATRFSGESVTDAGGGGELDYAIAADPGILDPLKASSGSAQIVARQIFEPLVESLDGPYGEGRDRRGLALSWSPSGDFRVWSLQLRAGVRFQDGSGFDAGAVLANARRWRTDPEGIRLLPGLTAADAPTPLRVRLIFSQPIPDLPARLAGPQLGIVSPSAMVPASGAAAELARARQAGTGPFELGGRELASVSLPRYRGWWGSPLGLGPALDQIRFRVVADQDQRLHRLRSGAIRVAADLSPRQAAELRADPLFSATGGPAGTAVGFERSVRGITAWRPASLSGVWIALLRTTG
jgi:ABC-type transport system substrate-binding protein